MENIMKILTYTLALSAIALSGTAMTNTAHAGNVNGGASEYKMTKMDNKDNKASSMVKFQELNNDEGIGTYKAAMSKTNITDIAPAAGSRMSVKSHYNTDLFD
jgi:hypothetical protein